MALNKQQMEAMQLLLEGTTITDTAKIVGVTRKAIYNWKEKEEWKDEWNKRIQEIKTEGNNRITHNLDKYVTELEKIALTGKSEKVRKDALEYLVDRVLGRTTTKIEQSTDKDNDNKDNFEDIDNLIDNVIDIEDKKKAK